MRHHGTGVFEDLVLVPVLKSELLRGVRVDPGGKAGPRGIANGNVAMGLREGNSTLDQFTQVRSFCLGVPAEGLDIIVQIVTDDKQNIRFVGNCKDDGVCKGRKKKK
jgi:hypothetical protein